MFWRLIIDQKASHPMYVRWERQSADTETGARQEHLVALLVESGFPDANKNATVLAHLGSIQERFLHIRISRTKAFHQGLFWVKVDQALAKLGLEETAKQALEVQIAEKVPRPGDDWALWGVTCIPQIDC
jgi:hypothetical protein